jgi:hypothetical protein
MQPFSDRRKSIAGAILIVLGILLLSGKPTPTLALFDHLVSAIIAKALWAFPDAILTVSRILHPDGLHPKWLVQNLPHRLSILVPFVRRLIGK